MQPVAWQAVKIEYSLYTLVWVIYLIYPDAQVIYPDAQVIYLSVLSTGFSVSPSAESGVSDVELEFSLEESASDGVSDVVSAFDSVGGGGYFF